MPTPSLILVPARFKTGKLYTPLATTSGGTVLGASGDFNVTRATTATRVNASGLIESIASGIPRLDYYTSGGTAGCPALLVEPAATNSIRNNSMVGASVSGNALPTNWTESLNGLVRQSVALGTENGVSYIDIRYSGTASASSAAVLFETVTQIVASTGQTWSNSVYLKIIAQPNPPVAYRLSMWEYNTSGTVFGGSFATAVVPTTTSLQRFTQTRALTGATTDRIRPLFDVSMTSGQSYDFTIRIGYPQMELGSVATSVIPTTNAAVTRNADVINLSGAVSGCIGQTEGTIYAEVNLNPASVVKAIAGVSLNSNTTDFAIIQVTTSNFIQGRIRSGTGTLYDVTASSVVSGIAKIAYGYGASGSVLVVNGTVIGTNASGTPNWTSGVNFVHIGNGPNATTGSGQSGFFNDRIRATALYTTRLTNAQLQALTT